MLNGSFDELMQEATGAPGENPNTDLSALLAPATLLAHDGGIMDQGAAAPIPTDRLGTLGPDVLLGGAGVDRLLGREGADTLDGGGGRDFLAGGRGDDLYIIRTGQERVAELAGEGVDTVQSAVDFVLPANVEVLRLMGSAIRGTIRQGEGAVYGNAANNLLDARGGVGRLFGGAGNDTYYVDGADDVVSEETVAGQDDGGVDLVQASVSFRLGAFVEHLTLTGSSALNGTGNALANRLTGNSGDNRLMGEGGADTLNGGRGSDTLIGGAGNDVYYVESLGDTVVEQINEGIDTVRSSITYTLPANVEALVLEGTANLNGTGNAHSNTLTGNPGANSLDGGGGSDTMSGGAGNDIYFVDRATDRVVERAGEGTDTVYASVDYTMPANAEVLNLKGAAVRGTINPGGDGWIYGSAIANVLDGRGGTARMHGGAGDDVYFVDSSGDRVVEAANGGIDTVNATISYVLSAEVERLILGGTANLSGSGNDLANDLTGNAGANRLRGGGGADTLTGGDGADIFVFTVATDAGDVVRDFTGGSDRLDVAALLRSVGYAGSDPFGDGYLAVRAAGADLDVLFDANGGGDNFAMLVRLLDTAPSELTAGSWIL